MLRLLFTSIADGATQMATDEALLEAATVPTLRLYRWQPPAISLGCFQDFAAIVPRLPPDMAVVRRITGGGAIWHEHEVTYCLVGTLGELGLPRRVRDGYGLIHGAIQAGLRQRGVAVERQAAAVGDRRYRDEPRCFASPAIDDLVRPGGGKLLGSAGRTRGARMLVHGSLKLASNPWDGDAVASCGLAWDNAAAVVREAIAGCLRLAPVEGELTAAETAARDRIRQERYGDDAWVRERRGPRA
jgi:lipoate-protein ligase A